jgi:hypothetical protein
VPKHNHSLFLVRCLVLLHDAERGDAVMVEGTILVIAVLKNHDATTMILLLHRAVAGHDGAVFLGSGEFNHVALLSHVDVHEDRVHLSSPARVNVHLY